LNLDTSVSKLFTSNSKVNNCIAENKYYENMALQKNLEQTTMRNFFYCFFLTIGQIAFGYPASVISVTLGQPAFLTYMGLADAQGRVIGNLLNTEGATSGVFQAGAAVGTIFTAIVMDRFGRRNCVYYNSIVGLFGGALIAGSRNISMFLAGRFFAGMSSFGFLVITPVYSTELSPRK
jgi:MFS family permease